MVGIPELKSLGDKACLSSYCHPCPSHLPGLGTRKPGPGARRCKGRQADTVGSMSRALTSAAEVNNYFFFFLFYSEALVGTAKQRAAPVWLHRQQGHAQRGPRGPQAPTRAAPSPTPAGPRHRAYRPRSPALAGTCSGSPRSPLGSGSASQRPPTPAPWRGPGGGRGRSRNAARRGGPWPARRLTAAARPAPRVRDATTAQA